MKRIIALIMACVLLFTTAACTKQPPAGGSQTGEPGASTSDRPQKTVKVTLDANGGDCEAKEVSLPEGGSYGDLPEATKEGYVFQGWFTALEGGAIVGRDTPLVSGEDHTLYAQWKLRTEFTATLDPNGGRISPYSACVTVTVDEPYGVLPEPIREGYLFLGWYTEPEAGEQVTESTVLTQSGDLTLYAHWEYDAEAYWTYVLHSRVQTIPQCRRVVVYLEKTAAFKTYPVSSMLEDAGAINAAEGLANEKVSDSWILAQNPYLVVKLTSDIYMGAANKLAMQKRLGDLEIYIFPVSAVSGSEKVQVYYRLQLAKILYPEYFADVDLNAVAAELELRPRIYY